MRTTLRAPRVCLHPSLCRRRSLWCGYQRAHEFLLHFHRNAWLIEDRASFIGFSPISVSSQRIAQFQSTRMRLWRCPFVLGARSSPFNHCFTAKGFTFDKG